MFGDFACGRRGGSLLHNPVFWVGVLGSRECVAAWSMEAVGPIEGVVLRDRALGEGAYEGLAAFTFVRICGFFIKKGG